MREATIATPLGGRARVGARNPYVFIVGCPRSGTTLTERILDAHPDLAVTHETRWMPNCYMRREGVTDDGLVAPDLVEILLAHKRFGQLGVAREELEHLYAADAPLRYADFVSRLLDRYGAARGKRLVGDKTPRYARFIPVLHELWPHARFIHVIRDGRDVYLSARSWISESMLGRYPTWRTDPAFSAGLWWTRNVRLAREAGAALGSELYRELRYERLVSDPEAEIAGICAFLELDPDPGMLRFHERRDAAKIANTRPPPGRSRLPVTPGLRDWRTQLTVDERERFEATAGALLEELGYERPGAAPTAATLAQAARVRAAFSDVIRARGLALPERW